METIFWPDEIRSPSALNLGVDRGKLHDNEIKMAVSLIENLSTSFEPAKYQNEYRQALWELIESKIVGKEVVAATPVADRGNVVDLMEALKASVKLAEEIRQADQADSKSNKAARSRRKTKTGS
jgi:DNA end-binding protein Ku